MAAVLILGVTGAGKSTLARELRRRGHPSYDADDELGRWLDVEGRTVAFPAEPDRAWLSAHDWYWDSERLDRLLERDPGTTQFTCGISANASEYYERFDLVMYLEIDTATMRGRLADPSRDNRFGRAGDTLAMALDWLPRMQADMKSRGVPAVDARPPVAAVADDVLRLAREHGLPLPTSPKD
jgi:gluconate kinase